MSNMIRRSLDPQGQHVSPLGQGQIDEGFANLKVKLLWWPEEEPFKRMVFKAVTATRGNDINAPEEVDPAVVDDAFKGGLNQCLEWVTVVFECSGVSRGLTHELVRTRQASFAQQSMRHTDMGKANLRMPTEVAQDKWLRLMWMNAAEDARRTYEGLVTLDVPYQDARTVLPIGTETYIIASYPLKVFLDTYAYRACYMFYPEIVELFRLMKIALLEHCLWLEPYVKIGCEKTAPREGFAHQCTYQGWERVEGHCPFAWAVESNRVWKSKKYED